MAGNIQRRPEGKWRARYRDANHREHARHFERKRDAERWLASQEVAIARGEWVDPTLSKITVGEWLPHWLARQVQLKPTTMVRYDVALRRQILPRWELVPLARITHSDVSSWVHSLTDEGLAPATVRYAHRVLSLALTAAVLDGRLVRNVAEGVPLPRVVGKPKRFLTHDQVQSLAEACAPYGTLVKVLAYAGLRWGELAALTARRVDLKRRRIEVVEAITEVHGRVVVGTTKTHQRRSVPIPRFLADELADHLAGKAPGDLVFTAPEGGVLRNTNFRPRFFDPAAEKVGLLGLTPHELRHTAASLAIAAGANVKAVQLMLGHASAAMTLDIYAGLFADDLDAVADRLDRAFVKLNADQMRTKRRTSRPDQTELPFENPPEQGTG
jgi:integrase